MSHYVGYLSEKEKCDRKAVCQKIARIAEEDGDGWLGKLKWHDGVEPCSDREAAEEFIRAHDKGWYDDHAVRYLDYSDVKVTKKMEEIKERIKSLWDKRNAYEKEHSIKNLKAVYIGCPKCGSKLAKEFLRSEYCPLCREDLRSKTTKETLFNYEKKRDGLQKQYEDEMKKQKGEVRWLVKYEYHC